MCKSCYTTTWERKTPERRERYLASRRRYNAANREKRIAQTERLRLKRLYNTTPEEVAELRKKQNDLCAICKEHERSRRLAVDHKPGTKQVRGLLCLQCNTKLGWFEKYEGAILEYIIGDTAKIVNAA